jgi:hypothetical protein
MNSWAGVHSKNETTTWYRGSYCGSPTFDLRVNVVPRTDAGGGWTDFHFSCAWKVNGTRKRVADTKLQSEEFVKAFNNWLDEQKSKPSLENSSERL